MFRRIRSLLVAWMLLPTQTCAAEFRVDQHLLTKVHKAATLAKLTYNDTAAKLYVSQSKKHRRYYATPIDTVLVSMVTLPAAGRRLNENHETRSKKSQVYCIAAFRGTSDKFPTSLNDPFWSEWAQNLNGVDHTIQGDCKVSRGIFKAYNFTHRRAVERRVRACHRKCKKRKGNGCDVLLTGHSQGGAIANLAGIILRNLDPYVVTFGQPPTLSAGCGAMMEARRWYRFTQALPKTPGLKYDVVPTVLSLLDGAYGRFFGHETIISADDAQAVNYIGLNTHEKHLQWSVDAHSMSRYVSTLEALLATADQTERRLPTEGFSSGSRCNSDDECNSNNCRTIWWAVPTRWECE